MTISLEIRESPPQKSRVHIIYNEYLTRITIDQKEGSDPTGLGDQSEHSWAKPIGQGWYLRK
jgi:hypothetical protein